MTASRAATRTKVPDFEVLMGINGPPVFEVQTRGTFGSAGVAHS
jgi:hypothetical protein